jgi:hypothetical protein
MTVQIIKINNEDGSVPIYSPFSGIVTYEMNKVPAYNDETVLFASSGFAGEYDYVSPTLLKLLGKTNSNEIDLDIKELIEIIQIENVIIFEVDYCWGGIYYFCFAPQN